MADYPNEGFLFTITVILEPAELPEIHHTVNQRPIFVPSLPDIVEFDFSDQVNPAASEKFISYITDFESDAFTVEFLYYGALEAAGDDGFIQAIFDQSE